MTLRKVPGVVALGLLASLAAHATLFRGDHAMGGAYHAPLLEAAIAACVSLLAFFGALAWGESGGTADGSVLAARLRDRLPGLFSVLPAAGLWYAAAEALEPHHAPASPILILVSLAAAAWLVLRLAGGIVGALARAAIFMLRPPFSPRAPSWNRRARLQPIRRRAPLAHRRFARPPPIAVALTRA